MNYYDYFPEEKHTDSELSMDEFIAEATRTDVLFRSTEEEIHALRAARSILISELFTCYEYLKERDLLELYQAYRNGEDLPFK